MQLTRYQKKKMQIAVVVVVAAAAAVDSNEKGLPKEICICYENKISKSRCLKLELHRPELSGYSGGGDLDLAPIPTYVGA